MKRQTRETVAGFLFVSPWLVGFVIFTAGPMIASLIFSFANYNFTSKFEWVGIKNYVKMLTSDYDFWNSVGVTFRWVFIREPIFLLLGLCAALMVNRKVKGVGIYRTLFYIPSLVAGTVSTAVMWKMLLAKNGQLNALLSLIGIQPVAWFQDPRTAMGALIVTSFISFGGPMVIFLAGLKNIPEVYYEAATIDGANALQKFLRITIPMLSPVLFFQAIMGAIWAFQSFTVAFVISAGSGGPAGHDHVLPAEPLPQRLQVLPRRLRVGPGMGIVPDDPRLHAARVPLLEPVGLLRDGSARPEEAAKAE